MSEPLEPEAANAANPDKVYLYAADTRGHTYDQRTKFPPWCQGLFEDVVASTFSPYTNVAQLVRDAVIHRAIYWRDKLGSDSPHGLDMGLSRARLEDRVYRYKQAEDFIQLANNNFKSQAENCPTEFRADLMMALETCPSDLKHEIEAIIKRLGDR